MSSAERTDEVTDSGADRQLDAEEVGYVLRARQGNEAAWEWLVRRYQEPVFRLAYLIVGDADDAEDVAQETFVRAYLSLDRFDVSRPLRPWLMQIAANLARNRRRSLGRYWGALQRFFQISATRSPLPTADATGAAVQHRLEAAQLWRAVQQLPSGAQDTVYLRYFLGLSEAETAEALGVAPGTVKSRMHRALQRLQTLLNADYPELQEHIE
jgi:RNA polymerase sigma-70 factor (ECF subfamily)